jgi:hypothetical protein
VVLEQSERWWLGLWKYVEPEMKLKMAAESKQGFWSRLTSQERETLSQLIDLDEVNNVRSKQYIGEFSQDVQSISDIAFMNRAQIQPDLGKPEHVVDLPRTGNRTHFGYPVPIESGDSTHGFCF